MKLQLFGDSISRGYFPFVQELLAEAGWEVDSVGIGTSASFLQALEAGQSDPGAEVVHLNCGLHDLRYYTEREAHQTKLGEYVRNLRALLALLRAEFSGRLIWATTTPVRDECFTPEGEFIRRSEDVAAYNAAALEVVRAAGVQVNDLHRVVSDRGKDSLVCEDGTHFTEGGYRILAQAVAAAVRGAWLST
ncbi:MAG: SGNH/GDSL hydrolase family protein [candidate division WS1 bacterium]|jgi:lysophospholipase L1-like esterase|nr:SGNH/GDSL hydrolase family protein [candidate division WS1 bacterium]